MSHCHVIPVPRHLAIDPGNRKSGWVLFSSNPVEPGGVWVEDYGDDDNDALRCMFPEWANRGTLDCLCIEMMRARGMPTANEELEACVQIGRFLQAWPGQRWSYVFRQDVKLTLCGQARAKDPNVRQALIDLWGGEARAIGGKRCGRCGGAGVAGRAVCPTCGSRKCKRCHGRGVTGKQNKVCGLCNGQVCPTCRGQPWTQKQPCPACNGTKWEVPPGPLRNMAGDTWAALGVAYTWSISGQVITTLAPSMRGTNHADDCSVHPGAGDGAPGDGEPDARDQGGDDS